MEKMWERYEQEAISKRMDINGKGVKNKNKHPPVLCGLILGRLLFCKGGSGARLKLFCFQF
jgi:hypothetical protein